jgi:flagellar biosynthesis protein FliR
MEHLPLVAIAARIFGLFVGLPLGDSLQILPRLFIAAVWGAALVPEYSWFEPISPVRLGLEFLIGILTSMPLRFLIESAAMFGEILDMARGQTIASITDPLNGQQVSDLTTIARVGVTTFAVILGAFEHIVSVVRSSYVMLPYGTSLLNPPALAGIMQGGIQVMQASLLLSSTWLVGYLLCDLVCALLSKVLQGLSFSTMGALMKLILTVMLLINLLRDTSGWGHVLSAAVFAEPFGAENNLGSGNSR